MNKANDCLMIGSYVCSLNSELFLYTDKKHIFSVRGLINAEKQMHFDFESAHVCYFYIDLGMSLLSNKW